VADVRLSFQTPTRLPVGAAVHVDIVTDTHDKALTVPSGAVMHEGSDAFVMVAGADAKAHKHTVKTGLQSPDRIEILSGLTAGDQAIVRGQDGLPDGAAIQIVK
jgi:multidrug efflux pump subunit AcrA (membrane-fusion protein)